jgi:4-amino-4-deoxy-L-arabinose transferase-like glycosyltransferase
VRTTVNRSDRPDAPYSGKTANRIDKDGHLWEVIALVTVLILALVFRLWGLDQNRWGIEYYTAAVRSMAMNWHNFFYTAFDPAGFISIDKPPVALWLQVISVKLFGFHPLSILMPQVLEGVSSVWILFRLVRRRFGASAALLSALFLAITPVWVAVNRTNNTDSCLLLVLLLATWALMKAAEDGNRRMLLLSMALIGLAFNVKMLAAFIVLPVFFIVYLIGAPQLWQRKFVDLAMATLILVVSSLPWVFAYEFTQMDSRPFVGSSRKNSMLELVIGHNAFNRFASPATYSTADRRGLETPRAANSGIESTVGAHAEGRGGTLNEWSRLFVRTPTGPLRLADGQLAAQVGWLFPFAVIALVMGARQKRFRRPLTATHLALLFWFCWTITYGGVYSYLGGIIHFYYLSTMAPALAALAGIGVVNMWSYYLQKDSYAVLLPATLLVTAAWQLYIQASALGWSLNQFTDLSNNWLSWLHIALTGGTLVAAAGLLLIRFQSASNQATYRLAVGSLTIGLMAVLVLPVAWALSSVFLPGQGVLPSSDLYRLVAVFGNDGPRVRARPGQSVDISKLVAFLRANRKSERYLLATSTTQLAAPIIIDTGQAVMARGGFHGLDPAVTPETLAQMVAAKQVRFVMIGDVAIVSRRMGARTAGKQVAHWVRANGKLVDPALWRTISTTHGMQLYDLRPETGLVQIPAVQPLK